MSFVPGSPQNGLNCIPRDLDRAIAYAMLPAIETFLVHRAKELAFAATTLHSSTDALPFTLSVADLSREIRVPKRSLRLALRRIERRQILIVDGSRLYSINRKWMNWLALDGSPLFDAEHVLSISLGMPDGPGVRVCSN